MNGECLRKLPNGLMNNTNGIACGIVHFILMTVAAHISNEAEQWSNPDRPNMQDLVLCVWLEARNLLHIA